VKTRIASPDNVCYRELITGFALIGLARRRRRWRKVFSTPFTDRAFLPCQRLTRPFCCRELRRHLSA
jgi:hypothetical protein